MRTFILCTVVTALVMTGCAAKYATRIMDVQKLVDNRDFEDARAELKRLIGRYPEEPRSHYLMGKIDYLEGNYYACLTSYYKAENMGLETTGRYLREKGIAQYHTGNSAEAIASLTQSIGLRPTPEAQRYLGLLLYESGDYAAAIPALEQAKSRYASDADVMQCLGMAYQRTGDMVNAFETLAQALELDPENQELRFETARLGMLTGHYDTAAELFDSFPPGSPFEAAATYNLGEALIRLGEFYTAAVVLKTYLKDHPGDFKALYNLAAASIETENYSAAVDILTTLHTRDETDVRVAYNLGIAYQGLGASDQAVEQLSTAVRRNPDNAAYRYAYGLSLAETGSGAEAEEQMERALAIDSSLTDAREWLERYRSGAGAVE